jgi:hypothetical protein
VESARVISSGILEKYKLMFHKVSDDGSGKCDAFFTDEVNDKIFGVIYSIHKKDLNKLDSVEGCGYGYEKKDVFIEKLNGETIEAFTYCADNIAEGLKPYLWYKYHILHGAVENDLPYEYISFIDSVNADVDPDVNRATVELSIYKD